MRVDVQRCERVCSGVQLSGSGISVQGGIRFLFLFLEKKKSWWVDCADRLNCKEDYLCSKCTCNSEACYYRRDEGCHECKVGVFF
jgi:hypothetical protein